MWTFHVPLFFFMGDGIMFHQLALMIGLNWLRRHLSELLFRIVFF